MTTLHEKLLAAASPLTVAEERTPEELAAVIRAVVELHAPTGLFRWCSVCYQRSWPCSTIQAIARELGVDG